MYQLSYSAQQFHAAGAVIIPILQIGGAEAVRVWHSAQYTQEEAARTRAGWLQILCSWSLCLAASLEEVGAPWNNFEIKSKTK